MTKELPMKPSILQFATDAQALIDREYKIINETTQALDVRQGELVLKAAYLLEREKKLNAREQSQDHREEEIVRKESLIRDTEQARTDRESATLEHQAAEKALARATVLESEVKQKEQELYARELALSEQKKTYKAELKEEFVNSVIGRVL